MNRFAKFGIPNNFNELLPELRSKTLKWETVCHSVSKMKLAHMKFLEAMENLRQEIENVSFEPDLMIQWGIPVTFVTAQRDQISTKERIDEYCAILNQKSSNFKHLCLPKKKHTFEHLYADHTAIINLIKSQRKHSR